MVTYFNLTNPDSERLFADIIPDMPQPILELSACPVNSEHYDGRRHVGEWALQVKHNRRDELIIWQWISGLVVHKSLLGKFADCGFTGYRLKPATVRFRDGAVSQDYQELIVTGWAGVARPESGIKVVKSCPACRWKKYSGLTDADQLIDWSQWTGEDFFKSGRWKIMF